MTSRWRTEARKLISEAIDGALEEQPELRADPAALIALVSKAYPFGERKHHPYKIWLDELAVARARFAANDDSPLARKCGACGAKPGKPCRPISDVDALVADRELVIETAPRRRGRELADQIVHAARRSPASGPLFAEASR